MFQQKGTHSGDTMHPSLWGQNEDKAYRLGDSPLLPHGSAVLAGGRSPITGPQGTAFRFLPK